MNFTWSYSSLSQYETCPKQFYELRVRKAYKQVETEQIKWGNEVHKAIEEKAKENRPLPERMKQFNKTVEKIQSAPGQHFSELKLAITEKLTACEFFDADVWARGITDHLVINGVNALNIDWKTGKPKKNSRQLMMSSGLIFAKFPEVKKVTTAFIWLAYKDPPTKETFYREQYNEIWEKFRKPLEEMRWSFENNAWPPKESGLCAGWCPVTDCVHWKPKRVR